MKIGKKISLFFLALIGVISLNAQEVQEAQATTDSEATVETDNEESKDSEEGAKKLPISYNAGVGLFNYRGDIGQVKNLGTTENFELGFTAGAEYLFFKTVGVSLSGTYGHISKNERNETTNRNFRTSLIGVSLSGTFHFANGFIFSEGYPLDPFISVGATYLMFDPHSDLFNSDNVAYNYWRDGSIRDQVETSGPITANEIDRDYEYETQIDANGESTSTIGFPITLGCNFRINNYLSAQVQHSTMFTLSDFVDGHVGGQANDVVSFTNFGFTFNPAGFKKSDNKKDEFDDIDFASLLKADGDADGVLDIDDWCQETDENIKVDKHGCPIDKDGDGIADNKDLENDTKEEALKIDSNGVTIPDSIVALEALDTIVTLREELCAFYPSMCQGDESDIEFSILNTGKADKALLNSKAEASKKPIEDIKKIADINKDGKIGAKEIYESIDLYFDGKVDLELGDIHKLIDYFFEQ